MSERYESGFNLQNISNLLVHGFSFEELNRLQFVSGFGELGESVHQCSSKSQIASVIIKFSIYRLRLDALLDWCATVNPDRYTYHQPYRQTDNIVMRGMLLSGADFTGSHMPGVILDGVYAVMASADGANFSGGSFVGADLSSADLTEVKINEKTRLSDGIKYYVVRGMTARDIISLQKKYRKKGN